MKMYEIAQRVEASAESTMRTPPMVLRLLVTCQLGQYSSSRGGGVARLVK